MALWGKEDKTSARPKSIKLNSDGTIAQDASGKKLVYLSKEEAITNASKGASGAGWYTVLKTGNRTRLELLVAISDENRASVDNAAFAETHFLNSNASVYADGAPGIEDPQNRPGWYFINNTAGKKVNWYFYTGSDGITLGNFSAYAVVTLDNPSNDNAPFFGIYTAKQNDGNDASSWYRSRVVYVVPGSFTVGTKYLLHTGADPLVHTDLPRIQLQLSTVSTTNKGPRAPSEVVSTASLGSNSASAVNTVKFVAESIGIVSPSKKVDIELRLDSSNAAETSSGLS